MTAQLEIPEPAFDAAVECIRELPQGAKLANLDHHDLTRAMFDAALPHLLDWFAERLTSDEAAEALVRARHEREHPRTKLTPVTTAIRRPGAQKDLRAVAAVLVPGREDGQANG